MFISKGLGYNAKIEHVHVNTWESYDARGSDHDPTLAVFDVCKVRDVCKAK
jgi:hypothetical protein